MSTNVRIDIRMAAIILLKNDIACDWSKSADEEGKEYIRSVIMDAIVSAPKPIMKFLRIILKAICYQDYPERFPNLIPQILQYFSRSDLASIIGAAMGIFILVDVSLLFERIRKVPLKQFFQSINERMLFLCETAINSKPLTAEHGEVLRRLLRNVFLIVRSTTLFESFYKSEYFQRWMVVLFSVYALELPSGTIVCRNFCFSYSYFSPGYAISFSQPTN